MKAGSKKKNLIEYIRDRSIPKEATNLKNSDDFKTWQKKRRELEAIDLIEIKTKERNKAVEDKDENKIKVLTKKVADLEKKYIENYGKAEKKEIIEGLETDLKLLETSLLNTLKDASIQTFTYKDIRDAVKSTKPKKKSSKEPQFTLVTGLNIRNLNNVSIGKDNSSEQLASQFDLQESRNAYAQNPIYTYHRDRTQGPQASIASPESRVAAFIRKSLNNNNKKLPDILKKVPKKFKEIYSNGYLNLDRKISWAEGEAPEELNEKELRTIRKYLEKHIDELNIFPQFLENGSMQVCCAAPTFNKIPAENSEKAKIAELLVVAQYKAMARLAVLRSRATGKPESLNLTLVGQGVFKNPEKVMNKAMAAVSKVVKGENVHVYVHAFKKEEIEKATAQLEGGVGKDNFKTISANKLKAQDKKLSEELSTELTKTDKLKIANWAQQIDLSNIYANKKTGHLSHLPAFEAKKNLVTVDLQDTINMFRKFNTEDKLTRGDLNVLIEKFESQINTKAEALEKPWRGKSTGEKTLEALKESLVSLKKELKVSEPSIEEGKKRRKEVKM